MTRFPPMPLLPITSPGTVRKCSSLPLREGDVFVCSYPKSGTTWTQHVVLSLLLADRRGRAAAEGGEGGGDGGVVVDGYDHVSDLAPFFEIDAHWEADGDRLAASVRKNHDGLGRRVFNTHLRWEMLPKRKEGGPSVKGAQSSSRPDCGRFIYVVRDLPDVCASFYHHLSNQKEGTYTDGFERFALDWMDGEVAFGSPLHHLLSFAGGFGDNRYSADGSCSQEEDRRPLLLLSYERMKSNLREEVLRVIEFLDLKNVSARMLDEEILPTLGFDHMREDLDRFQPRSVTWLNGYKFLRKGVTGDGRKLMAETSTAALESSENGEQTMTLMEAFRDWVEKEGYREEIASLVDAGLDEDAAEQFMNVVK